MRQCFEESTFLYPDKNKTKTKDFYFTWAVQKKKYILYENYFNHKNRKNINVLSFCAKLAESIGSLSPKSDKVFII